MPVITVHEYFGVILFSRKYDEKARLFSCSRYFCCQVELGHAGEIRLVDFHQNFNLDWWSVSIDIYLLEHRLLRNEVLELFFVVLFRTQSDGLKDTYLAIVKVKDPISIH